MEGNILRGTAAAELPVANLKKAANMCKKQRLLKREYDKHFNLLADLFGTLINEEDMSEEELNRLNVLMAWDRSRRASR